LTRIERKMYPPRDLQQLRDLHRRIISSETTLHNKHCLILYLLKDLSPRHHGAEELASSFARNVHLEQRFWTFIEGLWSLDHLEFKTAVGHLTHPSIIPTFPDEIMYTLLRGRDKLRSVGLQKNPEDDILPLAYYNCAKPPLDDVRTRDEYVKYLSRRNVTETFYWIRSRPEHEHKPLLEIFVEETLEQSSYHNTEADDSYPRQDKMLEFVSLPLSEEEEELVERYLTEGKGRTFLNAPDTVLMRGIAMGRLTDVAGEHVTYGRKHDGLTWTLLKDGVRRGLGPRKDGEAFTV
jgi:hypothetical protein